MGLELQLLAGVHLGRRQHEAEAPRRRGGELQERGEAPEVHEAVEVAVRVDEALQLEAVQLLVLGALAAAAGGEGEGREVLLVALQLALGVDVLQGSRLLDDMSHDVSKPRRERDVVVGAALLVHRLGLLRLQAVEESQPLFHAVKVSGVELWRRRGVAEPPRQEGGRVDQGLELQVANSPIKVVVGIRETLQEELVQLLVFRGLLAVVGDGGDKLYELALLLQEDGLPRAAQDVRARRQGALPHRGLALELVVSFGKLRHLGLQALVPLAQALQLRFVRGLEL
mmetsp:Transcript_29487/g.90774  ORF Transcript_29487/g.90774 Transcript_29487/m.90774 type:complete len:284 (+) Transcript_29487:285-1136(+)